MPYEAKQATSIYETQGNAGLERHFHHVLGSGSAVLYLLDHNWKDVLDSNPSARAVDFVKVRGKTRDSSASSQDGADLPLRVWLEQVGNGIRCSPSFPACPSLPYLRVSVSGRCSDCLPA